MQGRGRRTVIGRVGRLCRHAVLRTRRCAKDLRALSTMLHPVCRGARGGRSQVSASLVFEGFL